VTVQLSQVSIGLQGSTPHDVLRQLASRIESAGFRGLWLNDTPAGDSLAGLRVAADATATLHLGTGVIPLDRRSASAVASSLSGLPADRVTLGIGAGGPKDALARVSAGVAELREATSAELVVGALGPRMRQLGAERADGVLLSWLSPAAAAKAMADLRRDAAGRPGVRGILYARTAVEAEALAALEREANQYAGYPAYAANFERTGERAIESTIDGTDAVQLRKRVAAYTAVVDELVLRAVPAEVSLEGYSRFVELAAAASPS
jgi:alkanesulfonate monooxygenase SsuD/methylene tetrahydromethanopterin reductase-like flavin-dependent oxidoreductase (luciferase family)